MLSSSYLHIDDLTSVDTVTGTPRLTSPALIIPLKQPLLLAKETYGKIIEFHVK
jgi:hypothetical protein